MDQYYIIHIQFFLFYRVNKRIQTTECNWTTCKRNNLQTKHIYIQVKCCMSYLKLFGIQESYWQWEYFFQLNQATFVLWWSSTKKFQIKVCQHFYLISFKIYKYFWICNESKGIKNNNVSTLHQIKCFVLIRSYEMNCKGVLYLIHN